MFIVAMYYVVEINLVYQKHMTGRKLKSNTQYIDTIEHVHVAVIFYLIWKVL